MDAGAGHDQISDAGKPGKALDPAAHLHSQPCDLRNPPGDQRRLGVVAVTQPVRDSGRQGDYIFQGTAQFNA